MRARTEERMELEEARALGLERLKVRELGIRLRGAADVDPAEAEAAKARAYEAAGRYFRRFASTPTRGGGPILAGRECVCGALLSGFMGRFQYGIAHGDGRCTACQWPARADHYVPDPDDPDGEPLLVLRRAPLPYHPDDVERRDSQSRS